MVIWRVIKRKKIGVFDITMMVVGVISVISSVALALELMKDKEYNESRVVKVSILGMSPIQLNLHSVHQAVVYVFILGMSTIERDLLEFIKRRVGEQSETRKNERNLNSSNVKFID